VCRSPHRNPKCGSTRLLIVHDSNHARYTVHSFTACSSDCIGS
jgi:hypothetical protein